MWSTGYKHKIDGALVWLVCLIVIIGLVILASASSVIALQEYGNAYYYLIRQLLFGVIPGLILFIVLSRIDYHLVARWALVFLIISLLLLIAVLIPGVGVELGGASRWLQVGPVSFQPSEFFKLFFILYLAVWFDKKGWEEIRSFTKGVVPFLIFLTIAVVLLILQPDMGTMMVVVMGAVILYFAAGARLSVLFFLILAGLASILVLIKVAPYRLNRLTVFLNPESDPLNIGWHVNQALLAVGSGGFWGVGLGHSRQKYQYLPEVAGDSIFPVVAEELGFLLTSFLVLLLVILILRGIKIAKQSSDNLGRLIAIGIISWLGLQMFVNITAMLNLLPLTGIPLPLVSHGGTAMAVNLAALGMLVNISGQTRKVEARR